VRECLGVKLRREMKVKSWEHLCVHRRPELIFCDASAVERICWRLRFPCRAPLSSGREKP